MAKDLGGLEAKAFHPKPTEKSLRVLQPSQSVMGSIRSPASSPKVKVKEEPCCEDDVPEGGEGEEAAEGAVAKEDAAVLKLEGARPPPVNSDYLPLPWKGRLGFVSLSFFISYQAHVPDDIF